MNFIELAEKHFGKGAHLASNIHEAMDNVMSEVSEIRQAFKLVKEALEHCQAGASFNDERITKAFCEIERITNERPHLL